MKSIHRGDVYWAQLPDTCGSVQRGTRPVVVISNNMCNCHSSAISVIPVTTQEDNLSFLHIKIHGTPKTSYAMCEQVMTVDKQMLQSFIISISDVDMKKIDQALINQLDLPSVKSDHLSTSVSDKDKQLAEIGKQAINLVQQCMDMKLDQFKYPEEFNSSSDSKQSTPVSGSSDVQSHSIVGWTNKSKKSQIDKFNDRLEKCREMNSKGSRSVSVSSKEASSSSTPECSRPSASKWTPYNIKKFVEKVEECGIQEAASSYSLSISSARSYYSKFRKGKTL